MPLTSSQASPLLTIAVDEALLLPAVRFLSWAFYILPLARLVTFRLTGMSVPISTQMFAVTGLALFFVLITSPPLRINRLVLVASSLLLVSYIVYLATGATTNTRGALLGAAWIYLLSPVATLIIGALSAKHGMRANRPNASRQVSMWLLVSTTCILAGIVLNAIDLLRLGSAYGDVYAHYGTTALANFEGVSVPRLSGAYFSGLDLTFAVLLLLIISAQRRERPSRIITLILYSAVALTFTRNAYVIIVCWLLVSRLSNLTVSRIAGTMYILGPVISLGVMAYLAYQVNAGALQPSEETSSILTRLSSWTLIASHILPNPLSALHGLGLTQNSLSPGESEIFAIDSFFLELICYAGAFAFLTYGFILRTVCNRVIKMPTNIGRITIIISALIPIAGVFNSMAGTMLMTSFFLFSGIVMGIRSRVITCAA